jgi:hypothetical protein
MLTGQILTSINERFAAYVQKGLFSVDFIGPKRAYYSAGRCHSRVIGLLVGELQRLGYTVDIERAIFFSVPKKKGTRKMRQFRPDITVVDDADNIVGLVEFETIDATKEHLLEKIDYFKRSLPANPYIRFVIFITTLTVLQSVPNNWIEKNRAMFVEPLTKKLSELSSKFPHIEFCFAFLNDEGVSARVIVAGTKKGNFKKNIFEQRSP